MLCDIVEMNNCHLLLGIPWQYDCKVVHDCVKNVFTVEKGGWKFSLIPLQNEELGRRNLSVGRKLSWQILRRLEINMESRPVAHRGWM